MTIDTLAPRVTRMQTVLAVVLVGLSAAAHRIHKADAARRSAASSSASVPRPAAQRRARVLAIACVMAPILYGLSANPAVSVEVRPAAKFVYVGLTGATYYTAVQGRCGEHAAHWSANGFPGTTCVSVSGDIYTIATGSGEQFSFTAPRSYFCPAPEALPTPELQCVVQPLGGVPKHACGNPIDSGAKRARLDLFR